MNLLVLKSDGQIQFKDKPLSRGLLAFLGFRIELAPDYTLRSFFRLLETYPDLTALNPYLPSFVEQYRQCAPQGCHCQGLDHLELARTVEMIGHPGPPGMQIFVSLEGVCDGQEVSTKAYWIEHLLDQPLKLGKLKHLVFGDKLDAFNFDTVFSLS